MQSNTEQRVDGALEQHAHTLLLEPAAYKT